MSVREQFAGESIWIGASDAIAGRLADAAALREFGALPRGDVVGPHSQQVLKRMLDLAIAIPALLLLLPLLAAIALWIALDSAGPVLFRQTRRGLGGRPFTIVKFRTMNVLENGASVVQATQDDPRVTRAGRSLRRASLDELPQLLNVIRGEMSLVGPRPHALAHDDYYVERIEDYALRQQVKPGITGWAQVHGLRGETPTLDAMRQRVLLDVWYARNADLALDLEILLRTPFEVLRQRNAH
jgi:exopolysaccharide biosynthesis polyprenyl glycosylphosphotransferase